jgi:sugar lactone lactonase YvrE
VSTIVGQGLFDYGDVDGTGDTVRLQHPLGITFLDGRLYVADTYNNKIKVIEIKARESKTFAGGQRGTIDGDRLKAQFNEPAGISGPSQSLFVADTNNHLIRRIDLKTGQVSSLELKGLGEVTAQSMRKFRGELSRLGNK